MFLLRLIAFDPHLAKVLVSVASKVSRLPLHSLLGRRTADRVKVNVAVSKLLLTGRADLIFLLLEPHHEVTTPQELLRLHKWAQKINQGSGTRDLTNGNSGDSDIVLNFFVKQAFDTEVLSPENRDELQRFIETWFPWLWNTHVIQIEDLARWNFPRKIFGFSSETLWSPHLPLMKLGIANLLADRMIAIHLNTNGTMNLSQIDASRLPEAALLYIPKNAFDPQNGLDEDLLEFCLQLLDTLLHQHNLVIIRLQMSNSQVRDLPKGLIAIYAYHVLPRAEDSLISYKETPIRRRFSLSPFGYSGWGPLIGRQVRSELPASISRYYKELVVSFEQKRESKYTQRRARFHASSKLRILVTLQTQYDPVTTLHSISTSSAVKTIIEWAEDNDAEVVLRRHPMCMNVGVTEIIRLAAISRVVVNSWGKIIDEIDASDIVVTGNSGTGLEAALLQKKVITWGKSEYGRFVTEVTTTEALARELDVALNPEQIKAEQISAFDFFCHMTFGASDPDFAEKLQDL